MARSSVVQNASRRSIDETKVSTAWTQASDVPGWLKEGQARLLWDEALALPPGNTVLEIGSHQGRSTLVLGHAARVSDGTVIDYTIRVAGAAIFSIAPRTDLRASLRAS